MLIAGNIALLAAQTGHIAGNVIGHKVQLGIDRPGTLGIKADITVQDRLSLGMILHCFPGHQGVALMGAAIVNAALPGVHTVFVGEKQIQLTIEHFNILKRFAELEGIDIHDAPAVAVASLAQAVKDGAVKKDETIMLNITGGGEELAKSEISVVYAKPHLVIDPSLPEETIINQIKELFI